MAGWTAISCEPFGRFANHCMHCIVPVRLRWTGKHRAAALKVSQLRQRLLVAAGARGGTRRCLRGLKPAAQPRHAV